MFDGIFSKTRAQKPSAPQKPKTEWEAELQPVRTGQPEALAQASTAAIGQGVARLRMSAKYIFIALAVLGIGFIGVQWWLSVAAHDRTELRVEGPVSVRAGEEITYTAVLLNKQKKQELRDASLTFRADDGTVLLDMPSLALYQRYLGALSPMGEQAQELRAAFWGKQGDERTLEVTARYRIGESANRFEKTFTVKAVILDAAVQLAVNVPQQVITDQEFRSSVAYRKLTDADWAGARLALFPPEGFSLKRADPAAEPDEPLVWNWERLEPQENSAVVFDGSIASSEGQAKEFKAQFSVGVRSNTVVVGEASEELSVIGNPLALTITASEDPNAAPVPGDTMRYRINYKNNYDVALKDIVIVADPTDAWFERGSLRVDNGGFYSSRDQRITWSGGTTPQLLALNPQESGSVSFGVKLADAYPANAKEPVVTVRATMSAQNKPKDVGTLIQTEAMLQTKIQGRLSVTPRVVFRDDPQTGFTNTGTVPLRANQATQYSMYLTAQAVANAFTNIGFKTILPAHMSFDGKIKGEVAGTNFVYNPRTGELSWALDRLEAYATKTIVVQLTAIPSSDQIGKLIVLCDSADVKATDAFTNTTVELRTDKVLSDLPDDDSIDANTGRVTP